MLERDRIETRIGFKHRDRIVTALDRDQVAVDARAQTRAARHVIGFRNLDNGEHRLVAARFPTPVTFDTGSSADTFNFTMSFPMRRYRCRLRHGAKGYDPFSSHYEFLDLILLLRHTPRSLCATVGASMGNFGLPTWRLFPISALSNVLNTSTFAFIAVATWSASFGSIP